MACAGFRTLIFARVARSVWSSRLIAEHVGLAAFAKLGLVLRFLLGLVDAELVAAHDLLRCDRMR